MSTMNVSRNNLSFSSGPSQVDLILNQIEEKNNVSTKNEISNVVNETKQEISELLNDEKEETSLQSAKNKEFTISEEEILKLCDADEKIRQDSYYRLWHQISCIEDPKLKKIADYFASAGFEMADYFAREGLEMGDM